MTTAAASHSEPLDIFCLHYLGGSAREWRRVSERVGPTARVIAINLPGFGDAAQTPGYGVAEMAASVAAIIRARAPRRWMLVGHSMGAKVGAAIARSAEDGSAGLTGLAGIITLAGSPPAPEPMNEQQRQTMLGWFRGDAASSRAQALQYVRSNSGPGLDAAAAQEAVADALRANRAAWVHWLAHGSREDWAARIDVLRTPALVVAGAEDEQLGPDAQRALMLPHFANVRSVTLANARHLLPLERSHEVARLIDDHLAAVTAEEGRFSGVDTAYRALIDSPRVSRATRYALRERGVLDDPAYEPRTFDRESFALLRAVVARVVPQDGVPSIDLAARIDAQLHAGTGDGWRFAVLPPDAQAYRAALLTLRDETRERHARDFADLDDTAAADVLERIAGGRFGASGGAPADRLDSGQMRAWFEDLRADAVKLYMAHPATLARLGFSGIANGGDGEPKSGFFRIGAGEREDWEPAASGEAHA